MVLNKNLKKIAREKIYQCMLDISNWCVDDKEYIYNQKWGNYRIKMKNFKMFLETNSWNFIPIPTNFFKRQIFMKKVIRNQNLKKEKESMGEFLKNLPEEDKKNILRKMKLDRII